MIAAPCYSSEGGRDEKASLLLAGMALIFLVNLFPIRKYHWNLTVVRSTAFFRNRSKLCLHNTKTMIKFNSKDNNNNNNNSCRLLGKETVGMLLGAATETMKITTIQLYI